MPAPERGLLDNDGAFLICDKPMHGHRSEVRRRLVVCDIQVCDGLFNLGDYFEIRGNPKGKLERGDVGFALCRLVILAVSCGKRKAGTVETVLTRRIKKERQARKLINHNAHSHNLCVRREIPLMPRRPREIFTNN